MMSSLRLFGLAVALTLSGCATQSIPPPPRAQPPIDIPEATWQRVDHDIHTENLVAKSIATGFARRQMEAWRERVRDRSETHFIPWFSGYLTQQWLTTKVAWYNLISGSDESGPEDRLASYIQEQYFARVLAPVAKHVDPRALVGQSTLRFTQHLSRQLHDIPERYGIPADQFAQHLKEIPAIRLNSTTAASASLLDIVSADPIDSLPSYAALLQQVHDSRQKDGVGLSKNRVSPVARRVSEQLVQQLAIRGGTGAASTIMGKIAGSVFSLGVSAVSFLWHEAKREDIEIALRETLDLAMDDMWAILMDSPESSVTSGIYHLFEHIDDSLPQTFSHALPLEPPPREIALPDTVIPTFEPSNGIGN